MNNDVNDPMWDYTGKQFCPNCHKELFPDEEGAYDCYQCGYGVNTSDLGDPYFTGYPTLKSTYSDLVPIPPSMSSNSNVDDIPEGCFACGGPWPDCVDSCELCND